MPDDEGRRRHNKTKPGLEKFEPKQLLKVITSICIDLRQRSEPLHHAAAFSSVTTIDLERKPDSSTDLLVHLLSQEAVTKAC
jgi:hypothetical protein